MQQNHVAIYGESGCYSKNAPFHPQEVFPEYPFPEDISPKSENGAYSAVRKGFRLLGLDDANFGEQEWNPLEELIVPGDHVLLKPNLIRESHSLRSDEWEQVITHPSIIRAVLDYVFIALKGKGKVIIADGPQTDSDFEEIVRRTGLDKIVSFFATRDWKFLCLTCAAIAGCRRRHYV